MLVVLYVYPNSLLEQFLQLYILKNPENIIFLVVLYGNFVNPTVSLLMKCHWSEV